MKNIIAVIAVAVLVGCASFSTNVFRTEQTLTGTAYIAYVGYTNGLANGTIKPSVTESNAIRTARLDFSASVSAVESWRSAYETNSAVKPQLQSALDALTANSSKFVALINLLKK